MGFVKQRTEIPIFLIIPNSRAISEDVDGILVGRIENTQHPFFSETMEWELQHKAFEINIDIIPFNMLIFQPGMTIGRVSEASLLSKNNYKNVKEYCRFINNSSPDINLYVETGSGSPAILSRDLLLLIRREFNHFIFYGGGVKTFEDVETLVKSGILCIITGTLFEKAPLNRCESFLKCIQNIIETDVHNSYQMVTPQSSSY